MVVSNCLMMDRFGFDCCDSSYIISQSEDNLLKHRLVGKVILARLWKYPYSLKMVSDINSDRNWITQKSHSSLCICGRNLWGLPWVTNVTKGANTTASSKSIKWEILPLLPMISSSKSCTWGFMLSLSRALASSVVNLNILNSCSKVPFDQSWRSTKLTEFREK